MFESAGTSWVELRRYHERVLLSLKSWIAPGHAYSQPRIVLCAIAYRGVWILVKGSAQRRDHLLAVMSSVKGRKLLPIT